MKKTDIYTDGSSLGNPGPGGWGFVVVLEGKISKEQGGFDRDTTNNRMELKAVIEAVRYVIDNETKIEEISIFADSNYVLSGVTSWIHNWEKNGWRTANKKPVLNQELWKELINLVRKTNKNIIWQKVKGHAGDVYNERADEIATTCAQKQEYS